MRVVCTIRVPNTRVSGQYKLVGSLDAKPAGVVSRKSLQSYEVCCVCLCVCARASSSLIEKKTKCILLLLLLL